MNSLYKQPLHGVSCTITGSNFPVKQAKKLSLAFGHIDDNHEEKPCWQLSDSGERYSTEIALFKSTDFINDKSYYLRVNCQGSGLFKITDKQITVDWKTGTDSSHYFQTIALALWLELKNILCIHANALACDTQAIALVAPSRTGKTTLTTALSSYGFAMMTDDMMALHQNDKNEYLIYPSWPIARLWPDSMNNLLNEKKLSKNKESYDNVHQQFDKKQIDFDDEKSLRFCHQPKTLKTIYFLNRVNDKTINSAVSIEEVLPAQIIILLLQNSTLGGAYKVLGLEQSRVKQLSHLFENVICKQVTYRSGKQYLSEVCQAIKDDCL